MRCRSYPADPSPALIAGSVGEVGCFSFTVFIFLKSLWVCGWELIFELGFPIAAWERSTGHRSLQRGGRETAVCPGAYQEYVSWVGDATCLPPPEAPHVLSDTHRVRILGPSMSLLPVARGSSCLPYTPQVASEHPPSLLHFVRRGFWPSWVTFLLSCGNMAGL